MTELEVSREPEPNACRLVDGPDDTVEFIWTTADGRGILHEHGDDGCLFESGGEWAGRAEEAMRGLAGEPCAGCGQVHDGEVHP